MKVLIVFYDVNHPRQIESLIGRLDQLASGSRVIITTRDKQVLKNCWANHIYRMTELVYADAHKLFRQYGFGGAHLDASYKELAHKAIEYAQGVPLALTVLGRYLCGRSKGEWESAMRKLEIIPHTEIQEVLKISYDSLDDSQKNIFLDIACFLEGEHRDEVISFFYASGFQTKIELSVLEGKSLISLDSFERIRMHDLLRDMGREIVRKESIDHPGKRSRLWHHKDIYEVLKKNTGTEAIKGISLDMDKVNSEIQINPSTFSVMIKLRFLKFYAVENKCMVSYFEGVPFTEVRCFQWHQCPLKTLNIHAENLVSLKMRGSNVKQLWDDGQNLVNLKKIDLSHSKSLTKLPDLSLARNLEILYLSGCSSLTETHSSIQYLNKLEVLYLDRCESLTSLPTSIHSKYLKKLVLRGCSNLKNLPEMTSCHMHSLPLFQVGIEELPSSIEGLSNLKKLYIDDCLRLVKISSSIFKLQSLKSIHIHRCSNLQFLDIPSFNTEGTGIEEQPSSELKLKKCSGPESLPSNLYMFKSLTSLEIIDCPNFQRLPDEVGNLKALKKLRVSGTAIRQLPKSLGQLALLSKLELKNSSELEYISSSIFELKSLESIEISNCPNLKRFLKVPSCNIDGTGIDCLSSSVLKLNNCSKLESLPSKLCMLKSLTSLEIIGCKKLERLPDELGSLEALKELRVEGAAIREVPESLGQLALLSKLELKNCSKLEYITSSIFKLKSLEFIEISNCSNLKGSPEIPSCNIDETGIEQVSSSELRLENCSSLESFPSSVCMFKSLSSLEIVDCKQLKRLPDELGNLEALKWLTIDGTAIREVPESLGQLAILSKLELKKCSSFESLPNSLCMLKSLISLEIIDCENFKRLPDELGNLEYLKVLTVKGTAIGEVPESLGQLFSLEILELSNNNLERIPESLGQLSSLEILELSNNNLERIPESFVRLSSLKYLELIESNLDRIPEYLRSFPTNIPSKLTSLNLFVDLRNCLKLNINELSEIVEDGWIKQSFHGKRWIKKSMYFPGNEIPKWFRHQSMGSSITLMTRPPPPAGYNKLMGFAFCAVVAFPITDRFRHKSVVDDRGRSLYEVYCDWKVKSETHISWLLGRISYAESDHMFLGSFLFDEEDSYAIIDQFFFHISFHPCLESYEVKKCGIHFVSAQDSAESHPKRMKYSPTP